MAEEKRGMLFMCVANSARSQMAEGIARLIAPEGVTVYSAGSEPSQVNPLAIKVMKEVGIDISGHHSKSVAEIPVDHIGAVIMLCADDVCPTFPGKVRRLHWPLQDPATEQGSDEDVLGAFRRVRDQIREKVSSLF
jgi:arsenate reductase